MNLGSYFMVERRTYINLFNQNKNELSWTYQEYKVYCDTFEATYSNIRITYKMC